jgi:hypothetical protein
MQLGAWSPPHAVVSGPRHAAPASGESESLRHVSQALPAVGCDGFAESQNVDAQSLPHAPMELPPLLPLELPLLPELPPLEPPLLPELPPLLPELPPLLPELPLLPPEPPLLPPESGPLKPFVDAVLEHPAP